MTTSQKLNCVDIVGPGAVGLTLASFIERKGIAYRIIGRHGLIVDPGLVTPYRGSALRLRPIVNSLLKPDLIVMAVKAYDLAKASRDYCARYSSVGCHVITVCNGYFQDRLLQPFTPKQVRNGFCSYGATITTEQRQRQVQIRSAEGLLVWPLTQMPSRSEQLIAERLHSEQIGPSPYAAHQRQKKWVFNCTINTLCAAYRLESNGRLLRHKQILAVVLDEAIELAGRLFRGDLGRSDQLLAELVALIQATAQNQNSMFVDLSRGRSTENPYLAGLAAAESDAAEAFPNLMRLSTEIAGSG